MGISILVYTVSIFAHVEVEICRVVVVEHAAHCNVDDEIFPAILGACFDDSCGNFTQIDFSVCIVDCSLYLFVV